MKRIATLLGALVLTTLNVLGGHGAFLEWTGNRATENVTGYHVWVSTNSGYTLKTTSNTFYYPKGSLVVNKPVPGDSVVSYYTNFNLRTQVIREPGGALTTNTLPPVRATNITTTVTNDVYYTEYATNNDYSMPEVVAHGFTKNTRFMVLHSFLEPDQILYYTNKYPHLDWMQLPWANVTYYVTVTATNLNGSSDHSEEAVWHDLPAEPRWLRTKIIDGATNVILGFRFEFEEFYVFGADEVDGPYEQLLEVRVWDSKWPGNFFWEQPIEDAKRFFRIAAP